MTDVPHGGGKSRLLYVMVQRISPKEKHRMKTAVFYENIRDGADALGLDLEEVTAELMDAGMEMLYLSPDSWKRDSAVLKPLLERLSLPVEGLHVHLNFPEDPDSAEYRDAVDLAVSLKANNLLIVPGMFRTGSTKDALESMVRGMRRAVSYGREKGMPVVMEDFDGLLAPFNSIAGLAYFLDRVEGLGCAFDTGNFVMFHEDELAAFGLFADRIMTVHLKDRTLVPMHPGDTPIRSADGRECFTCAVGYGNIRIARILADLEERGYAGNVIAELYGVDPCHILEEIRRSLSWIRSALSGRS